MDRIIDAEDDQSLKISSSDRVPPLIGVDLREDLDNLINLLDKAPNHEQLFLSELSQTLLRQWTRSQELRSSETAQRSEWEDHTDGVDQTEDRDKEMSHDRSSDSSTDSEDSGSDSEHLAQTQDVLTSVKQVEQLVSRMSQSRVNLSPSKSVTHTFLF